MPLWKTDGSTLYTLNKSTGAATLVGHHIEVLGILTSLAFDLDTNTLYGADDTGYLYTINTSNGVATTIGFDPDSFCPFSSMLFDQGQGYGVTDHLCSATSELVTFDKSDATHQSAGALTQTTIDQGGMDTITDHQAVIALNGTLYDIDLSTRALTNGRAMTSGARMLALAWHDDELFGMRFDDSFGNGTLCTINIGNGTVTAIGSSQAMFSIASDSTVVAEPATISREVKATILVPALNAGILSRRRRMFGAGQVSSTVSVNGVLSRPASDHAWGEEQILKHIFGIQHWDPPHGWLTVTRDRPSVNSTGLTLYEPDANDPQYNRISTVSDTWSIDAQGNVTNTTPLVFPLASTPWPEMNYLVHLDQPYGGNIIKFRRLDSPVSITTGQTLVLPANGDVRFSYTESSPLSNDWRLLFNSLVFKRRPTGSMGNLSLAALGGAPTVNDRGVDLTEPRDQFYSRAVVGVGPSFWEYVDQEIRNLNTVTFATPGVDWGAVTHIGVVTNPIAGDVGLWRTLATPQTVTAGVPLVFNSGELRFRL